jgi:DNA polymerase-3 subunit delta
MILKSYEINKIKQNNSYLILFYGKNEGLKKEALNFLIKKKNNISNY